MALACGYHRPSKPVLWRGAWVGCARTGRVDRETDF